MSTIVLLSFTSFGSLIAREELTEIVKMISPSTILILTYDEEGNPIGQGSGFFISQNGEVITNRHVILNTAYAEIKTLQGDIYPITHIIAEDKEGDIIRVLVDIPQEKVKPLMVSVSIPEVGERIVVIGNPLGLERTVADGIVSAVRDVPDFGRIIQITAPISPGSSGSPVVNMNGEVIGIATFQMIEGQNLNFAIPGERIVNLEQNRGETLTEWQLQRTEEQIDAAKVLYLKGLLSVCIEDYEDGLSFFEKAVENNPRYADAYYYIGWCNGKLGRYSEAVKAYKQVIMINPDYAEAYKNLGVVYGELRNYSKAVEAFKQAIRINPDDTFAHIGLGWAYVELGHYNEAMEVYKQLIRINPDDAGSYCGLGWIYSELGRYSEAIEAYKQAIRKKPDYTMAYTYLGLTYSQLGRYNEAIEVYKQSIRINPDYADAHHNLGHAYYQLRRYNEAIEAFMQAIRINPENALSHYNLGLTYTQLGRYTEAIGAYKQAIYINPNHTNAHYNLGLMYLIIGDNGAAFEEYKILKDLDKDLANKLFDLIYR